MANAQAMEVEAPQVMAEKLMAAAEARQRAVLEDEARHNVEVEQQVEELKEGSRSPSLGFLFLFLFFFCQKWVDDGNQKVTGAQ